MKAEDTRRLPRSSRFAQSAGNQTVSREGCFVRGNPSAFRQPTGERRRGRRWPAVAGELQICLELWPEVGPVRPGKGRTAQSPDRHHETSSYIILRRATLIHAIYQLGMHSAVVLLSCHRAVFPGRDYTELPVTLSRKNVLSLREPGDRSRGFCRTPPAIPGRGPISGRSGGCGNARQRVTGPSALAGLRPVYFTPFSGFHEPSSLRTYTIWPT